jgi:hypothetical protein
MPKTPPTNTRRKPVTDKHARAAVKSERNVAQVFRPEGSVCAEPSSLPSAGKQPAPRVTLAEALREAGIDERAIAGGYASSLNSLSGDKVVIPKEKLRLDILKDCARVILPERGGSDGSVPVFLVHDVPRPVRAENEKEPQ